MPLQKDMNEKYKDITTYKTGEVARRAGVNKETVRYYEERDLIPKPDRRRSGYRIFTQRHIDQIRFVKRAQELGFTLSEIKELLELRKDEDTTCSEIKTEAQEKYRDVVDKIEDLQRMKRTLLELIDSCSGEGRKGDCPILGGTIKSSNKRLKIKKIILSEVLVGQLTGDFFPS